MPRTAALLLLLLLVLGFSAWTGRLGHDPAGLATRVAINIAVVVPLHLLAGVTGRFSLGQAGFMAIGAQASAGVLGILASANEGPDSGSGGLVVFGLAWLAATALAGLAALLSGLPLRGLRSDSFALSTFALGALLHLVLGDNAWAGSSPLVSTMTQPGALGCAFGLAALAIFIVSRLTRSTFGRGFAATRDDPLAAEAAGLDTGRYRLTAWVIAALFAGAAGALHAQVMPVSMAADFDLARSLELAVMVLLGGLGRMGGAIAAALLLTVLPHAFPAAAEHRLLVASLLLLALALARPHRVSPFTPVRPALR